MSADTARRWSSSRPTDVTADECADLRTRRYGDRITSTVIDDASHALFPEQPDAVAAAITSYPVTNANAVMSGVRAGCRVRAASHRSRDNLHPAMA